MWWSRQYRQRSWGWDLKNLSKRDPTPKYVALFLCLTEMLLALTFQKKDDGSRQTDPRSVTSLGSFKAVRFSRHQPKWFNHRYRLILGIAGKEAARFSFLMALPAIGGATLSDA